MSSFTEVALRNLRELLDGNELGDIDRRGRFNRMFEQGFRERLEVAHALTFNSGTAALHGALHGLGVGPGDEVIVDPLLKYGAVAALHVGATPVFADVDADDFTLDAGSVAARVTERTRVVVATATFGLLADIDELRAAVGERVAIVEDCAQALFATRGGRLSGTGVEAGIFSFQATKHLSTGEGGLLVSDDDEVARRAIALCNHGCIPGQPREQASLGWMYRMPELCAAVGVAALSEIDERLAAHEQLASLFDEAIAGFDWIHRQAVPEGARHVWWTWAAKLDEPALLERLRVALAQRGAPTGIELGYAHGLPVHLRPVLGGRPELDPTRSHLRPGSCPHAESLVNRMVHVRLSVARPPEHHRAWAEQLRAACMSI